MREGEDLPSPPSDSPQRQRTKAQGRSVESNALDVSQRRDMDFPLTGDLTEEQESSLRVCRICLENEEVDALIHPCKCTGSVRYIHEECLKAWLASQSDDMAKAECELCKTPFQMTITLTRKWTPKDACNDGFTQCLFAPLLLAVLGMLVLIIYLLSEKYLVNGDSGEQRGYTAALVVTCIISSFAIVYLLFRALREACCSRKLTEWKILDYEGAEEEHRDDSLPHPEVKVEPTVENTSFPTRLDIRTDEDVLDDVPATPPVMVIPKRIKINGVKVKTPDLHSISLTPVNQRGRVVAVAPRVFAFSGSLSHSRASFNVTPKNLSRSIHFPGANRDHAVRPVLAAHRWTPDLTLDNGAASSSAVHNKSEPRFPITP